MYFSDAEYSAILSNIKDRQYEREKESYIMSKNTPFRYDYVGSFLRPETLKRARRDFEEGKISKEELTKVEDDAILDLVEKQKKPSCPQ